MTAKSKTLTLPHRALVTSTPKALLLRLTDGINFWYPRSLTTHDRHGYHLTLIPGMVTELLHGKAKEPCLAEELPSMVRVTKAVEHADWKSYHNPEADRHLRAIAGE